MGLSLRGATSGAIDINAPDVAGDNTITLPPSNGSANQFFKNSGTAGIVTYSSMIETPTNRVSIGFANPSAQFTVGNTDGSRVVEIQGTDGVIRGYNRDSSSWERIDFEASAYTFDCNAALRLTLNSGGTQLTGVSTATAFVVDENNGIHFRGSASDDLDAIIRESASNTLLINSRNNAQINIDSNGDGTGAYFRISTNAADGGSGTELLKVTENGDISATGNFSFTASDARAINAIETLKVNINSNGGVSNRVFEVLSNYR
jgi:hypothetical protein